MKYLFSFLILLSSVSFAENLLSDPEFKKPKDHWRVSRRAEYKKVVESYKRGIFHIAPNFSSSTQYLSLITPLDLEVGQTYELKYELCASGQGQINVTYGAYGDPVKGKKKKQNSGKFKNENLGLKKEITEFPADFTTQSYIFTVEERKRSGDRQRSLRFWLGSFTGDFKIKNLSLTKSDQVASTPAKKKKGKKTKDI